MTASWKVVSLVHWSVIKARYKQTRSSCFFCRGSRTEAQTVCSSLLTDRRCIVGGELQRFAIAVVAAQQADIYMIDEPSSYLDVRQRLKAAQV